MVLDHDRAAARRRTHASTMINSQQHQQQLECMTMTQSTA
jgi:hypothetical protein